MSLFLTWQSDLSGASSNCKNKSGKIMWKDNYRPIALAIALGKIIEIILCCRLEHVLVTWSNQFGFKRKLGTDHCIYTLKEMISFYSCLNSSVYTCFLDASKAFDRINHNILSINVLY